MTSKRCDSRIIAVMWAACWLLFTAAANAQPFFFGPSGRFELSDSIDVAEADTDTKTRLEQAKALAADGQWDEAIDTLQQVMEGGANRVIAASDRRYVAVPEYCQLRIAAFPDEALAIYRQRVDAQARRLYDEGMAHHDEASLARVVSHYFVSSCGDDALLALGDLALERGDHGGARGYWEKLLETPQRTVPARVFQQVLDAESTSADDRKRLEQWYRRSSVAQDSDFFLREDAADGGLDDAARAWLVGFWKRSGLPLTRLAYPGSDIDPAMIRARLVLASILEGSPTRATAELASYRAMHATARGRLGGVEVNYADALAALLSKAASWPMPTEDANWTTFAGSFVRHKIAPASVEPTVLIWQPKQLPKTPRTDAGYPSPRVAETKSDLLSYHPLVWQGMVFVNGAHEIRAYDLETGNPAWGDDAVIYRSTDMPQNLAAESIGGLGAPRFTMTIHDGRLYARMGDPLTTPRPEEQGGYRRPSFLVCLDLRGEGRLVWQESAPDKWAFEGSPVVEGDRLYVAMRHGSRPQAHVASYDARTGREVWRQFVASAETPARGLMGECTHNLLTLAHGHLYYNTNLGAVAALSADDGRPLWITHYPRAKRGDLNQRASHFYRDLTPCVYDRGRLFVAPSDSESIFAFDAATGLLAWETSLPKDAVHLLGVAGETLWASGEKLWRINTATGKVSYPWPEGPDPKGFGRGALAGTKVYFPTQKAIHIFDQQTGREEAPLELLTRGATGGNLVVARDVLLIAGSEQLMALGHRRTQPPAARPAIPPRSGKNASNQ